MVWLSCIGDADASRRPNKTSCRLYALSGRCVVVSTLFTNSGNVKYKSLQNSTDNQKMPPFTIIRTNSQAVTENHIIRNENASNTSCVTEIVHISTYHRARATEIQIFINFYLHFMIIPIFHCFKTVNSLCQKP